MATPTTTTLTSSPDPSECGELVTFTAQVTPAPTPGGTVTFIISADGPALNGTTDAGGQAQVTISDLSVGTHLAVASFLGDGTFDPSSSAPDPHIVTSATTVTTITTTPTSPFVCGQSVEVCATVTGGPSAPPGSVTITEPGGATQTLPLVDGQACYSTTLTTGNITANYTSSDVCWANSSGLLAITVDPASTTTTVTTTPASPFVCGQSVQVCAAVTTNVPGSGTPTGSVIFTEPGGAVTTVPLVGGQACYDTTTLTTGTITATYTSDSGTCFADSTAALGITVNPASTTTTVTTTPASPFVCGQSVQVCAAVTTNAPGSGTPTGSVTFTEPGGATQTLPLVDGQVCYASTTLTTGSITANYTSSNTSCFANSTGSLSVTVNPASTTTTVTTTPESPLVCGQSVQVCATVTTNAPGSGTPTGSVAFTEPGGAVTTVPLVGGQACYDTTTLTTGTITATYTSNATACFANSTGTLGITVNPASTTTTVTTTPASPFVCGQSVQVCAEVTTNAPGSGTPTGSVTFTEPGGATQTLPLVEGQVCYTSTTLTTGTITAVYNTDTPACFATSTGTLAITVNPASTTTTVTTTPASPFVCGQSVQVCATVTTNAPGSGTPTGSVTFTEPGGATQTVPLVDGEACYNTTTLTTGNITATYTSNAAACFANSTGSLSVIVNPASTTTTVTTTPASPFVCGQSVQVCATVTTNAPGSGTPTGSVTFTEPGGATQTLPLVGGQACYNTTTLTTGNITATYTSNAAACFANSTGTLAITVNPAPTTTTVSTTPASPFVCGQSVQVCATVSGGPGTPPGSVTFTEPGGATQTVPLVGGQACYTSTSLTTGNITANYTSSNTSCFANSTGTLAITVNPASTTTTVTTTPASPFICGQSVQVCATVATNAPGSGTPTGSVTFTEPGGATQTVPLVGGQACYTSTSLTTGNITAVYNSNAAACFATSTGTLAVTVNPASTTTTVTTTPASPFVCGQSVQVCATVTTNAPGSGTPTGTVTFTGPGGLNTTVPLVAGQACFASTTLATGTITAVYNTNAAACFATSTGTLPITVNPASTTTTITTTPVSPFVCGQSVQVCATVTTNAPGSGTPTGSVTFTAPGGATQTLPLVGGQVCYTSTTLITGNITANYTSSNTSCFANSTGTLAITVNPANTTTTITTTPAGPFVCGQSVQVCATVTANAPGSGTPTGSVTFTAPGGLNTTVPLAGGQACVTTSTLASGNITATYTSNAAACFTGSVGTFAVTVNPTATTTVVTATPNPSTCGQSVQVCATVTANAPGTGTPTGTVTFTGPGGLNTTVPLVAGQACFTSTTLATGTLTATYNGASCFSSSTGTVSITSTTTSTTITAPPAQVRLRTNGQFVIPAMSATLKETVSGAPVVGQTVVFVANRRSLPPFTLGTAVTDASGVATLAPPNLVVPNNLVITTSYTATFAGAGCLASSTVTAPVTYTPLPLLP